MARVEALARGLGLRTTVGNVVANELWSVATANGSAPRRMTQGGNDLAPSISPDGRKVAFIRTLAQSCQLCTYDLAHDSIEVAAESEPGMGMSASIRHIRSIAAPQWSPDGSLLAYIAPVRQVPPFPGSSATVIRTLPYQFDGRGYIHDNFLQIFFVAHPGGRRRVRFPPLLPTIGMLPGDLTARRFASARIANSTDFVRRLCMKRSSTLMPM